VAFKSLIARNKTNPISDRISDIKSATDDAVKMKLPFIIVNTSKETAIDCWLSADRCGVIPGFLLLPRLLPQPRLSHHLNIFKTPGICFPQILRSWKFSLVYESQKVRQCGRGIMIRFCLDVF